MPADGETRELSEQQERFCRFVVEGKTQAEAYIAAGYKAGDDNSARANASRLIARDNIRARVEELSLEALKRVQVKHDISLETVTAMLLADREMAHAIKQPASAVAAAMGIAKLHGMITDKAEVTDKTNYVVSNRPQTDEEWQTEFSPGQRPN